MGEEGEKRDGEEARREGRGGRGMVKRRREREKEREGW